MILLWNNKINRKKDNGLINKGIKINKDNNEIYNANNVGNIIEANLKKKSYKNIYYLLKKKNIIMNIIEKKIERKKVFIKENVKNKSYIKTELIINSKLNYINNWYDFIKSNRIYSIPSGLILMITGRMLKLKKASRTKNHKLILGNIRSKNYDLYYKTIIDKNGSIGIKLKIYSNCYFKSKN